jgi:hypothetical protein
LNINFPNFLPPVNHQKKLSAPAILRLCVEILSIQYSGYLSDFAPPAGNTASDVENIRENISRRRGKVVK